MASESRSRRRLPVISLLFVAGAAIFAALDSGIFDKMLLRFSSDKGSTLARYATFDLLSHFDWHELVLGPSPARVTALQGQLGLNYGIENFWISCIVQFGIVHTALLTIGLIGFLTEILRRASGGAWTIMLLILAVAASSVSFSSKNIQLAQFVILIAAFAAARDAEHRRTSAWKAGSVLLLPTNARVRPGIGAGTFACVMMI